MHHSLICLALGHLEYPLLFFRALVTDGWYVIFASYPVPLTCLLVSVEMNAVGMGERF